ncbi:MAG: hypothetical protein R3A52_26215 [Polyangiales bacterium]
MTHVEVAPSGTLSPGQPEAIIAWCESRCFTGVLDFVADGSLREVPFIGGTVEVIAGAEDPVLRDLELFLSLTEGSYTLTQRLPALEGSRPAGSLSIAGELSRHAPSSLMSWCETAGLDGQLTLERAPKKCVARYECGELRSLTIDGASPDSDVSEVFGWSEGRWVIQAVPLFPRESWDPSIILGPPRAGEGLLRTVEFALAEILDKRASVRPSKPLRASLRPGSHAEGVDIPPPPRAPRFDPPAGSADTTVKVYFVQARNADEVLAQAAAAKSEAKGEAKDDEAPRSRPVEMALWAVFGVCATVALAGVVQMLLRV